MLLNCGVQRRSVLSVHWKDWCWSWNANIFATWCEELTQLKRPWCWERLKAGGEGLTEDKIVGWHYWLNGHGFGWTLGVGDGQGGLACCSSWVRRVGHNWATELNSSLQPRCETRHCILSSILKIRKLSLYLVLVWEVARRGRHWCSPWVRFYPSFFIC